jgi:hypothetical protein
MKRRDRSRGYIRWIMRFGGRSCAKSSPLSLPQSSASFSAPRWHSARDTVDLGLPSKSNHEWTLVGEPIATFVVGILGLQRTATKAKQLGLDER